MESHALKLLRLLDEGAAADTGGSFFQYLVSSLAQAVHATCAFVSEISTEAYEARVLAYWCEGKYRDPFVYNLSGTPCECVLDNQIVAFSRNIQEMFPKDRAWFVSIGAQSFLAIPLCDDAGKVHGHLAILDRRVRDWNEVDREVLQVFAVRAGAELARRVYERRLEEVNAALQKANAQLRREVAQRLQAEDELKVNKGHSVRAAELVRIINQGITSKTGADFLRELVRSLAEALDVATVFVARLDAARYEAHILAIWAQGEFGPPSTFNLAGTPCESILDGQIAAFPRRVAELFPAAKAAFETLGTRSALAIPISDETATVIGHIAVQDVRERDWDETDFGILRLFANRACAELKRSDQQKSLEGTNHQLQRANAALRREVAARLDMEDELARAKKAAEDANHAKSSFLAHMSHELRTPLNGILGYAQLLRRDPQLGSSQLESVRVIERSGEHLLTLINDLLDLAKIEAGRLDLHSSLIDVGPLLQHVANLASVRAREAGLRFVSRMAPDLPHRVLGDERAIRQVLLNLLGNAVKFTRSGSVTFSASSQSIAGKRCRLTFEIEDTGPGMAPEELATIFEPFVRTASAGKVEGTGLGLPITQRLLAAMGGSVEVSSQLGVGSRFTVTVELDTEATESAAPVRSRRVCGYEGERRNALIVDNDDANRHLIARMFQSVGFQTVEAPDGAEALRIMRARRPDLVVSDLAMPVLGGLELARAVRDEPAWQGLPVIAVSASASSVSRQEALDAGFDGFLAKPVHAEELFELAGELLGVKWRHADEISEEPAADQPAARIDGVRVTARWNAELYDLAMRGDVKEIVTRADDAAASDPEGAPVYQEIQRLARKFDMKGVRQVLQQARDSSHD